MTQHHEIYFIILAFFAELIGSLSGVSSSALFVPIAKLLESVPVTLALTATLHVLGNSVRAIIYRKNIDWTLTMKFGVPSVLFATIGAEYSNLFSERIYSLALGTFLISLSAYCFYYPNNRVFKSPWLPYWAGGLSGLLTGMLGSGGAVRSLALSGLNLNPLTFLATSTLIDSGGDIFRLVIYIKKGYLNQEHYFYIPMLMIVAFLANWIAKLLIQKIRQDRFKKIVLAFVFLMGIISIVTA